jgi:excisionase family DNA binding protein
MGIGNAALTSRVDYGSSPSHIYPHTLDIQASAARCENSLADMVEDFETAITVQQLATILQCSRGQIYKLIDEKRLPALKVGTLVRLDPVQVADWIRSKSTIGVVN